MTSPASDEMQFYSARLATFHTAHQPNKRRKSSTTTRKRKDERLQWPHKSPSPEQLARAGFFYRPAQESADNVQCFFCSVKLDGWESTDDPIQEHLSHSDWCAWATARSVERDEDRRDDTEEERDPMSETMVTARQATFTHGAGWPHEGKKGWRCKVTKMVDAGWSWDPSTAEDEFDGVTCFYCNLSVDGWEPKDDPLLEHQRRMPHCPFFKLLERYHGTIAPNGKAKKQKSKRKGGASSSTAGRTSIQSNISDLPSTNESFAAEASLVGADDSIVTTSTVGLQIMTAGSDRSKKKAGRPKNSSKSGMAKKKTASTSDLGEELAVEYPNLGSDQENQGPSLVVLEEEPEERSKKAASRSNKKPTHEEKQVDSSMAEKSQSQPASKKASRSRKPKAQEQPQNDDQEGETIDDALKVVPRSSNASAQLQEELENSVDNFDEVLPADQSTPPIAKTKTKRGVKRNSDGIRKAPSPPTVVEADDSVMTQSKIATKPKKIIKPKQPPTVAFEEQVDESLDTHQQASENITELETQIPRQTDTDLSKESEPLPKAEVENLVLGEDAKQNLEETHADENFVPKPDSLPFSPVQQYRRSAPTGLTPSPSGSDKENRPSSTVRPSTNRAQPHIILSPTKTTKIPLAPGTPDRSPRRPQFSPSKHISHLSSNAPWAATDLDTVLLQSPQPTPGKLGQAFAAAVGELTSPERNMSVEEWINHRAVKGEEEMKRRCEEMVATFEREGIRGLKSLASVNIVG